ncbi:MAG: hypothetical protein ACJ79K_13285 [Gemmatimonadaceae bacterium]
MPFTNPLFPPLIPFRLPLMLVSRGDVRLDEDRRADPVRRVELLDPLAEELRDDLRAVDPLDDFPFLVELRTRVPRWVVSALVLDVELVEPDCARAVLAIPSVIAAVMPQTIVIADGRLMLLPPAPVVAARRCRGPMVAATRGKQMARQTPCPYRGPRTTGRLTVT